MIVLWIYRSGALATIRLFAFVWANASYPQVFYGATQTLCKLSVSLPELVIRLEAIEIALLFRIYNLSNGLVVPA